MTTWPPQKGYLYLIHQFQSRMVNHCSPIFTPIIYHVSWSRPTHH
uniref:Uncharacterized protein n=1 Tax=Rhizophora mucronata TaxID=61149 RepID=A0A2P2QKJ6_RHIMU